MRGFRRAPALLAAALALGLPACLTITKTVKPSEATAAGAPGASDFASFPKRPGLLVRKNPEAKIELPAAPMPTPVEQVTPPPAIADAHVVKAGNPAPLPAIPSATEPDLLAALKAFLNNKPNEAIGLLQSLDRFNQDFTLALMPLLVRGAQMNLASANPEEVALMVQQLDGLARRLEPRAALKVERVTFYRKFEGFGRFEPWPQTQPYGPGDLALLYFEVRNIGSEPAPGPRGEQFLSRLAINLEVRDARGNLVEQTDPTNFRHRVPIAHFEYLDRTRSPIRDFYRTYRISVPTQPGVYTVTVEVRDPARHRVARSQPVRFDVAGQ